MEEQDRPLYDEVLDVVVYAPIGAALRVAHALPDLVREGRARIEGSVQIANVVGRLIAGQFRRNIENRQIKEHSELSLKQIGEDDAAGKHREGSGLAIADYETLGAAKIVGRLGLLSPEELEDIRHYEELHRQRRTILGRIAQLQGDPRGVG